MIRNCSPAHACIRSPCSCAALSTYTSGRGARGNGTWRPVAKIVDALDAVFYAELRRPRTRGQAHAARARRLGLDEDPERSRVSSFHAEARRGSDVARDRGDRRARSHRSSRVHRCSPWLRRSVGGAKSGITTLSICCASGWTMSSRRSTSSRWGRYRLRPADEGQRTAPSSSTFVIDLGHERELVTCTQLEALRSYRDARGIPAMLVWSG